MSKKLFVFMATTLGLVLTAQAQESANPMNHMGHMNHAMHMAAMGEDARQAIDFPPEMRTHVLANMRDHLQALSEIINAMSGAEYAKAAQIARTHLSMDSSSADNCKDEIASGTHTMSMPASMDQQMAKVMPAGMRKIGLDMHQAASVFVTEATKASKTGKAKPALAALSRVTQQCVACHSAYKVQ